MNQEAIIRGLTDRIKVYREAYLCLRIMLKNGRPSPEMTKRSQLAVEACDELEKLPR